MSGTGGSISSSAPDREYEILCDTAADGTATPFMRRVSVDSTGNTTVTDTTLDGTTAYTPTGTVGVCPAEVTDYEVIELCDVAADGTVTPFLRRLAIDEAGTVTTADTALDGVTAYAPTGTVGLCPVTAPQKAVVPHGTQNTDWDLAANAGTQSVTLLVYSGSVTVTTAEGPLTVPAGTSLTWGVDGDTVDSELTGTLTIDGDPAAATWQVLWTTHA
ncbi:hypothetical protein [Streptomyces sp. TRM68367]|uniref:hypothetical protein n=1 Tax=Streptomyces sp. TRM68367 TaxID=2758415 RepID=UPI00165A2A09|nr:hypothetical protein [Streptomyces sp. TRM68367]MBC9729266.1 hypothetical protein [Streptomyces sp. TRM68367]